MSQQLKLSIPVGEGRVTMLAEEKKVTFEMTCGDVYRRLVFEDVGSQTEACLYDERGSLLHSYTASGSAREAAIKDIDGFLSAGKDAVFT